MIYKEWCLFLAVNFISRNAVEISMANFSKFDTIYATVTKPEGDFACDDVTDLERFMWVMTHDVSVFSIRYCAIFLVNGLGSPHFDIIYG
jgi:hypothetical protein